MKRYKNSRTDLKHAITKINCFLPRKQLQYLMRPDPHAGKDGKYKIGSVYFDNVDNKVVTEKK
ncbi:hypothetical protein SAMN05421736_101836 [Evansella caseinilytica]|uniref:Uncharacterized protein n=1 Tax=Evansella caseinilytica TaxID=1503961 RepID=A0A1H3IKL6_9BACI|nr:hypothetical protein [Evansella caseinilytica]SDY27374.1 hypothetical protein SAMN05421736_101836 [Evansella caseinilytica]